MSYIGNPDQVQQKKERQLENEVLILVQQEFYQKSPAEFQQKEGHENEQLKSFVTDYLSAKGIQVEQSPWSNSNTIELKNLPAMTLHGLTLKAEELGMNISYTRSLTIKITD